MPPEPTQSRSAIRPRTTFENGAPAATRTRDPLLRRQMLYPTELRAHQRNPETSTQFHPLTGRIPCTPLVIDFQPLFLPSAQACNTTQEMSSSATVEERGARPAGDPQRNLLGLCSPGGPADSVTSSPTERINSSALLFRTTPGRKR